MDSCIETVITKRRRPNKIAIYAKITQIPFGNLPIKDLPYPVLTYLYNIKINRVNKDNQRRANYQIQ